MVILEGPEHRVTLANAPYESLAGRVVLGKTIAEAFPSGEPILNIPLLDEVYKTGKPYLGKELPLRLNDASGNPQNLWIDIGYHPFRRADGKIQGVFALVHDVAEKVAQKSKEKAIVQQLRIVADFSPALIAHVDSAERYRFMNRLYKEWFGFDPLASLGKTILEVVGPVAYEKAKGPIQAAISGKHVHFENSVFMKDGTEKFLDLQFVPLDNSSEEMSGFIVLGYDITERKASESALRSSEAKYRESKDRLDFALKSAQMSPWHLDLKTHQVFTAFGADPMPGYEKSCLSLEEVVRVKVYPDDVEDTVKALTECILEKKPYDHEYRQLGSDGSVRWISSRAMPYYDEQGEPISISGVMADITERKLIADQYRAITELTPQFIWMSDEKGSINYSNSTLLNYMGVTDAATAGEGWLEKLHPDDRERTKAVWRNSILTGKPYEIEFRIRAYDGKYGWFLNRALPIREKATGRIDRWLGVSTDITARKNAEEELKRTMSILNSIMATSSDMIYVKDRASRMIYCNPTTLKALQASEASIYGKTDIEFLGPGNGGEEILKIDNRIMESGIGENAEEWITWPDGTRRLYLSHKEPQLDSSGQVVGMIGISRDITERKAAQNEIAKTVDDLLRERDIREKFVATLSHDLRNPLTSAKMSANLLARKSQDPEALQKLTRRIADSIDRADQMIRDLLDANLIRVGEKLPLEIAPLDLVQIATDTLDELSSVHGDRFVLYAPNEVHGFWSESGVRRVLENLSNNAIKYGDASRIVISLKHIGDSVIISVQNRGPSISSEDQATLFDPFKRSLSAKTGKQKGWGLGLTLIKGIAQAHAGHVTLESSDEKGTIFSVILPLDARS